MASAETDYKRRRRKVLAGGGIAAALLYVGGAVVFDQRVTEDLKQRVPEALAAQGIDGVTADFSGQDGTLTCGQPIEDPGKAEEIALGVRGVNKIDLDESCRVNTAPTTTEPTTETTEAGYETVSDIVTGDPGYAQLANRLNGTEIASRLSDPADGPFTVFAPSSAAFEALPAEQLAVLESDAALSEQVLGYHVVEGAIDPEQLVDGAELTTISGETLTVSGNGTEATIGGASITNGPISAENGLVYTTDAVLLPADIDLSPSQPPAAASATFDTGTIALTGVVASEAERDVLVSAAADKVGAENVTDKLVVESDTGVGSENAAKIGQLIGAMHDNLVSGEVGFDGDALFVNGYYATPDDLTAMQDVADSLGASTSLEERPVADDNAAADLEKQLNDYVAENPILFAPGSADITEESNAVIDRVAAGLQQVGGLTAVVEGHTDSDGDANNNQALSDRRAAAVMAALVERGVDAASVSSVGFGEDKPILVGGVEDKAASRRVIFTLTASN